MCTVSSLLTVPGYSSLKEMFEILCGTCGMVPAISLGAARKARQLRMGWGSATAPVVCARKAMRAYFVAERVESSQTSQIGSAIARNEQYKLSPKRRGKPSIGRSTPSVKTLTKRLPLRVQCVRAGSVRGRGPRGLARRVSKHVARETNRW